MTIGIIDPGSGNLTSVFDAVNRLGYSARILSQPELADIETLILPGQGRFGSVMGHLQGLWADVIRDWVEADRALIGICVGMQVMFESSEEDPGAEGLAILPGRVKRLTAPKVPMMGWSHVDWKGDHFPMGSAYFVNGYVLPASDRAIAWSSYRGRFVAGVEYKRMRAFQFHPEKSGWWGQEILRRCLA